MQQFSIEMYFTFKVLSDATHSYLQSLTQSDQIDRANIFQYRSGPNQNYGVKVAHLFSNFPSIFYRFLGNFCSIKGDS